MALQVSFQQCPLVNESADVTLPIMILFASCSDHFGLKESQRCSYCSCLIHGSSTVLDWDSNQIPLLSLAGPLFSKSHQWNPSQKENIYFSFFSKKNKSHFQVSATVLSFSLYSLLLKWYHILLSQLVSLEPALKQLRSKYLAPSLNTWRVSTFFWNSGDAGTGAHWVLAIYKRKNNKIRTKITGWKGEIRCQIPRLEPWCGADFLLFLGQDFLWYQFLRTFRGLSLLRFFIFGPLIWSCFRNERVSSLWGVNHFEHPYGPLTIQPFFKQGT